MQRLDREQPDAIDSVGGGLKSITECTLPAEPVREEDTAPHSKQRFIANDKQHNLSDIVGRPPVREGADS